MGDSSEPGWKVGQNLARRGVAFKRLLGASQARVTLGVPYRRVLGMEGIEDLVRRASERRGFHVSNNYYDTL